MDSKQYHYPRGQADIGSRLQAVQARSAAHSLLLTASAMTRRNGSAPTRQKQNDADEV
jgi:hypothetical protein